LKLKVGISLREMKFVSRSETSTKCGSLGRFNLRPGVDVNS